MESRRCSGSNRERSSKQLGVVWACFSRCMSLRGSFEKLISFQETKTSTTNPTSPVCQRLVNGPSAGVVCEARAT